MLNTLQAGRGIAAVAVLLFHLNIGVVALTGVDVIPGASKFGHRGVDFFFVLSGFIIMLAHHRDIDQPHRWSRFAYKRFARIYPVYWFYSALVLIAALVGLGATDRIPESFGDWFSTVFLLRVSDVTTPIGPGWTLFHEMLFYAAFSVLIISRRIGIVLMALWFGACAINNAFPEPNVYTPYTTAITGLNLDFLFGMAAFWASRKIRTARLAAFVSAAGALILVAAVGFDGRSSFEVGYLYGLGFAVLIAGLTNLERRRPIDLPLMTFLGNASYSIYLVHEPALTFSYYPLSMLGLTNAYALAALGGGFALLAGLLGYLLIEKPMMNRLRRGPPRVSPGAKSPSEDPEMPATARTQI